VSKVRGAILRNTLTLRKPVWAQPATNCLLINSRKDSITSITSCYELASIGVIKRFYISTLNIRVMSLNNAQEFVAILLKNRRTLNPGDMGLVEYCENETDCLIEVYGYIALMK